MYSYSIAVASSMTKEGSWGILDCNIIISLISWSNSLTLSLSPVKHFGKFLHQSGPEGGHKGELVPDTLLIKTSCGNYIEENYLILIILGSNHSGE